MTDAIINLPIETFIFTTGVKFLVWMQSWCSMAPHMGMRSSSHSEVTDTLK
jgi:hypothetical protein